MPELQAERILEIKMNYFKNTNPAPLYPDVNAIDAAIPDPDGGDFFVDQACRSITIYKKGELPYKSEEGKKVIIAGSEPSFFSEMRKYYKDTIEVHMSYNLGPNEAQYAANIITGRANEDDTIFVCV